jgi:hypothetical protein
MATTPQPDPTTAGGAPDAGAPPAASSAPSQAPASPEQIMLAKLYQACKALAQQNPILSTGLQKAAQGIQEAQTALVTQPQPQPTAQNPPY